MENVFMVKLRLKRFGRKRQVCFRIVLMNNKSRREGRVLCELGNYNPRTKHLELNYEEILSWMQKGAQPTKVVRYLVYNYKINNQIKD
uniref:Ribosomal protein S16 n=1 Tax=Cyanoptyche gloeocystis TaxID=77922 RepID=A0A3G1IWB2_9EUKA|nr:ribosomal protein S16 [Cyanoptyche gloeocystis]|mmetsp:Transcript_15824/g.27265  ORF Transcript_15824/g.27265 Transcript_15824/m.27265 type:complete len:88 (+) Transcript_15824:59-322(+)